jgi:hypothetical protein
MNLKKHFFEFKKNVYGYNVSSMGLLLRDPGMFALEIESSSKVTLNYKMDFSMIISLAEMLSWNDYPYKYVQNNKRSLLFKIFLMICTLSIRALQSAEHIK